MLIDYWNNYKKYFFAVSTPLITSAILLKAGYRRKFIVKETNLEMKHVFCNVFSVRGFMFNKYRKNMENDIKKNKYIEDAY